LGSATPSIESYFNCKAGKYGLVNLTQRYGNAQMPVIEIVDVKTIITKEKGKVIFSIVPQEFHYNPIGSVHGGVFCTMLDSALACAIHSTLPAGTGYTTLELKVNFIRPLTLKTGKVLAIGTLVHVGRSVATAEGRIVDEEGKLYAHATTTCMLFPWK